MISNFFLKTNEKLKLNEKVYGPIKLQVNCIT
jgi:hypothetical protein